MDYIYVIRLDNREPYSDWYTENVKEAFLSKERAVECLEDHDFKKVETDDEEVWRWCRPDDYDRFHNEYPFGFYGWCEEMDAYIDKYSVVE